MSVKDKLQNSLRDSKRELIPFEQFLETIPPKYIFRNIFNVVSDMVDYYIGDGLQEYPNDPESINYIDYDTSKMFEENQTDPFYPDRLFANRFVSKFKHLDKGSRQNKIYVFRGPPGSGKSTFLNCFINKAEEYVNRGPGTLYEVIWKLDDLTIPCPSHDNPILLIPKEERQELFNDILDNDPELKDKVFNDRSFEWLFYAEPCTFCTSILQGLTDKDQSNLLSYIYTRQYKMNSRVSEGISVFNSNDELPKFKNQPTKNIQDRLDEFFREQGSTVRYDHSLYAKSNNGIYCLMDLNDNNQCRLKSLRGIVSEGKHKVNTIEEQVNSLFTIVTNPDDEYAIEDGALEDRKDVTPMNYVLIPKTQSKIFKKIYGENVENNFYPGIIDYFSRIIIATRMNRDVDLFDEWLEDKSPYRSICDKYFLILKMEIYTGNIPEWLKEEDKDRFTYDIRKGFIDNSLYEGLGGISDRKAIELFGNLVKYFNGDLVNFPKLKEYCERVDEGIKELLPGGLGFIASLEKYYVFELVQQIEECLFQKNTEQIKNNIKNYLHSLYYNLGDEMHIGEEKIQLNENFYEEIESYLFGRSSDQSRHNVFRKYIAEQTANKCSTEETDIFKELYDKYTYGLKRNMATSFVQDENVRNALKDYNSPSFESYDIKTKRKVNNVITNMIDKYGYTQETAVDVCLYILS